MSMFDRFHSTTLSAGEKVVYKLNLLELQNISPPTTTGAAEDTRCAYLRPIMH